MSSALATQPEPAPVAKVSQPRINENTLLAGAGAVLLLAPLAFGAVQPWRHFALETCATVLLAAWSYRQFINRELNVSDHPLYRPMAAFLALMLAQWALGTTAYRTADLLSLITLCRLRHADIRRDSDAASIRPV